MDRRSGSWFCSTTLLFYAIGSAAIKPYLFFFFLFALISRNLPVWPTLSRQSQSEILKSVLCGWKGKSCCFAIASVDKATGEQGEP